MDENSETFVIHVASLNLAPEIHLDKEAWIASLLIEEVKILGKYLDFANIFSKKKVLILPDYAELNEYIINLDNTKQLSYGPIYSLGLLELETLKTYIETHLKTGFIQSFKFPVGASILFDKKPDSNLRLYIDYQGVNNLTINNWYPLLLIRKLFDRLDQTKRFTQLDLISTYRQMRIKEGDRWKTAF